MDLAPLELDCMNMLWPMGEGTVREIRDRLAPIRPRAYTTIMTIMDRLAQKGIVSRRKVGRAYLYQPSLTADQARAHAVRQLLEGFFGGSEEALLAHLRGYEPAADEAIRPVVRAGVPRAESRREEKSQPAEPAESLPAVRMDETLL